MGFFFALKFTLALTAAAQSRAATGLPPHLDDIRSIEYLCAEHARTLIEDAVAANGHMGRCMKQLRPGQMASLQSAYSEKCRAYLAAHANYRRAGVQEFRALLREVFAPVERAYCSHPEGK